MKVGVDAVLLGSWCAKNFRPKSILDVGMGCGVISLMIAQRFPDSKIRGIDIDKLSVDEAIYNFLNSPWKNRLNGEEKSFPEDIINSKEKYDLIVSNPPFFKSGINNPQTPREKARHQDSLSIFSLIKNVNHFLYDKGRLAIIFPKEFEDIATECYIREALKLERACYVRNNEKSKEKRILMELIKADTITKPEITHLTLFANGEPTEEYISLCKDFYLKF